MFKKTWTCKTELHKSLFFGEAVEMNISRKKMEERLGYIVMHYKNYIFHLYVKFSLNWMITAGRNWQNALRCCYNTGILFAEGILQ